MKNLRQDIPIYVAILLTVLVAAAAKAGTVTLNWVAPTTCTDGTAVTNCATTGYRVYGALQGVVPKAIVWTAIKTDTSAVLANVPAGTWCYQMTTVAGALESLPSNEVCKTIAPPGPNPPTLTTVTVVAGIGTQPVYGIVANGARSSAVYGFVAAGVPCSGIPVFNYRGNTYYHVDKSNVKWWATVPTSSVAAACKAS